MGLLDLVSGFSVRRRDGNQITDCEARIYQVVAGLAADSRSFLGKVIFDQLTVWLETMSVQQFPLPDPWFERRVHGSDVRISVNRAVGDIFIPAENRQKDALVRFEDRTSVLITTNSMIRAVKISNGLSLYGGGKDIGPPTGPLQVRDFELSRGEGIWPHEWDFLFEAAEESLVPQKRPTVVLCDHGLDDFSTFPIQHDDYFALLRVTNGAELRGISIWGDGGFDTRSLSVEGGEFFAIGRIDDEYLATHVSSEGQALFRVGQRARRLDGTLPELCKTRLLEYA